MNSRRSANGISLERTSRASVADLLCKSAASSLRCGCSHRSAVARDQSSARIGSLVRLPPPLPTHGRSTLSFPPHPQPGHAALDSWGCILPSPGIPSPFATHDRRSRQAADLAIEVCATPPASIGPYGLLEGGSRPGASVAKCHTFAPINVLGRFFGTATPSKQSTKKCCLTCLICLHCLILACYPS